MALLDALMGGYALPPSLGFDPVADPNALDPAAEAEAARVAAAERLARMTKRPLPAWGPFPGIDVGMLGGIAGFNAPDAVAGGGDGVSRETLLPPPTNDPTSHEPVEFSGGVPVPRDPSGTADAVHPTAEPMPGSADSGAVPSNATPTAGTGAPFPMAPAAAAAEPMPGTADRLANLGKGVLGKLFNPNNASTMLALAGGFAGAPSLGTGMRRAFSSASPAAAASRALELKQNEDQRKEGGMRATYAALIAKGVSPADALAAARNPDVLKAMTSKLYESKPLTVHDIVGPFGDKKPVVFDPNLGQFKDMAGNRITDASGGGGIGTMGELLAPGVKFDDTLTGDAYLGQFSKDVQAATKAYLSGDVIPTSNPRQKVIAGYAKTIAQRYGQDMGIPVSDAAYAERLTHRREMASGKAGVGLQRTALRQGLEHLEGATKAAIDLGNYSLGLAPLTEGVNAVRGLTDAQKGKVTAFDNKIQTLAGEVGKFFSSAQGGGVHERQLTRDRFKGITAPTVLADAIESTLELMQGGLHAREQAQQQLFGGDVPPNLQYMSKDDHARVERIRDLARQLREGGTSSAVSAPKLQSGQSTTINGVTIKRVD